MCNLWLWDIAILSPHTLSLEIFPRWEDGGGKGSLKPKVLKDSTYSKKIGLNLCFQGDGVWWAKPKSCGEGWGLGVDIFWNNSFEIF